ncbi:MAG: TetR/AcrR family transcriptional regulator [Pseudomonadota bacterium]
MPETSLDTKIEVAAKTGYHHGDLRSQLLNAVRQLVEEKGSENFSIAEAARKAGVSSAAPYRHFNDKPEILKALVMQAMEEKAIEMRRVIEPHPVGSLARINALGRCYIDFARNHPGMFRLVFGNTETHENDDDLRQQGERVFGIVVEAVAQVLKIQPDDPEALKRAYMLWTMVHGHSWLQIDGKAKQQGIEFPEEHLLAEISLRILGSALNERL